MSGDSATKLPALLTPGVYFSVLKLFLYKFLFPLEPLFHRFFAPSEMIETKVTNGTGTGYKQTKQDTSPPPQSEPIYATARFVMS